MFNRLKKLTYIVIAVILLASSVNLFLAPHNIAGGGVTGLAIVLEATFNFNRALVVFIFNMLILLLTYVFLGRQVFINTVIGSTLLPIVMGLIPHSTLINDPMLSMIAGSVLVGTAVAILYANQSSTGGTSIPPLILQKYFKINTSIGLFLSDSIIVVLSLLIFDVDSFLYSILSIFIASVTINYIESGLNKKKTVYILSDKNDLILNDILHDMKRGVTIIPVIGGFTKNKSEMLMITLDTKHYKNLINVIDKYDKTAFVITINVSDVHGRGFTYDPKNV